METCNSLDCKSLSQTIAMWSVSFFFFFFEMYFTHILIYARVVIKCRCWVRNSQLLLPTYAFWYLYLLAYDPSIIYLLTVSSWFPCLGSTSELQWLEHLWDHRKIVRDVGSSSQWRLIIVPDLKTNSDDLGLFVFFYFLHNNCLLNLLIRIVFELFRFDCISSVYRLLWLPYFCKYVIPSSLGALKVFVVLLGVTFICFLLRSSYLRMYVSRRSLHFSREKYMIGHECHWISF